MTASIVLVDLATGEVVLSDSLSANATLGTVSAQFAQTRSDRHADERLAMLLADRVAARLHLFSPRPLLMKVVPRQQTHFWSIPAAVRALLLQGNDLGLISERKARKSRQPSVTILTMCFQ